MLVNAAGIDARELGAAPDQRGPFEIDVEHFMGEVRVNAAGPMLVTRALLPQLIHGRRSLPCCGTTDSGPPSRREHDLVRLLGAGQVRQRDGDRVAAPARTEEGAPRALAPRGWLRWHEMFQVGAGAGR